MYQHFFKRLIDLLIALIGFVIISPIFIIVAICLFIANNGKPFFLQQRPGKNGDIFTIIKFKTMNDKKDANGELLSDAERLTVVGKIVRKTSLDEVPQLLNVIKGDMSLIGPRPLLIQYLPLYSDYQKRRHEVLPGITGWAQINGRNALTWDEKFALDIWYVDNISLGLDLKILLKTVQKVVKSEGVNNQASVPMPYFKGNTDED